MDLCEESLGLRWEGLDYLFPLNGCHLEFDPQGIRRFLQWDRPHMALRPEIPACSAEAGTAPDHGSGRVNRNDMSFL